MFANVCLPHVLDCRNTKIYHMYVSLFATSKISRDSLLEAVNAVLTYSKDTKRKFVESVVTGGPEELRSR